MKGNMQAVVKDDNSTLCLWANLKKNPRLACVGHCSHNGSSVFGCRIINASHSPSEFRLKGFHFEEVGLGFELPKQLVGSDIAVQLLHTRYDHLSMLARMAHLRVHTPSCRSETIAINIAVYYY